jgi:hypothetical protein
VRRSTRAAIAFVALTAMTSLVGTATTLAFAQRPKRPAANAPSKPKPPKGVKDAGPPSEDAPDAQAAISARAESTSAAQVGAPRDAGVVEAKTLDGGARSFRFGEIEIEGRLRSPQIVYFLRRVRAEFAAGDLGHRSFMRELSDTRRDPNF